MQRTGLVLCSLAILSCDRSSAIPDPSPTDINVILVLPFTGSFASRSEIHKNAIQMAFRDLEAGGDLIPGRRVRAWVVDAGTSATTAAERVQAQLDALRVGQAYNVAGIISSTGAAHQGSLALALDLQIPHFEISSGSKDEEFIDPMLYDVSYAFQGRALCEFEARMNADFIASRWQRVLLARGSKRHDRMHTDTIRARLAELTSQGAWTGTVLNAADVVMTYADDANYDGLTWRQHVADLKALYPTADTLFFHLRGDTENEAFFKALELENYSQAITTCGMARKPELLDPVNPGVADFLAGHFWFVMRGPLVTDTLVRFAADLRDFGQVDADTWAAGAYDAAVLLGLGVVAAQSTDGTLVRDAISASSAGGQVFVYSQLGAAVAAARQGTDIDYNGASGPMDIRPDRSVLGEYYVEEIQQLTPSQYEYQTLTDPAPEQL